MNQKLNYDKKNSGPRYNWAELSDALRKKIKEKKRNDKWFLLITIIIVCLLILASFFGWLDHGVIRDKLK